MSVPRSFVAFLLSPPRVWRRLRAWRRIHFTAAGAVFTAGAFAIGLAAVNTGNNLLYLLLGAMLGFIALSGWLSEQAIRGLEIRRVAPRGVTVGRPVRVTYHVTNTKRRFPTLATYLIERGLLGTAFIMRVTAGASIKVRSENVFVRRGVYPLVNLTVSTSFPFGLFTKERDVPLPGELVIWPRADLPVSLPTAPGSGSLPHFSEGSGGVLGARGEYRGLRDYRSGDDPRDIHWRTTARTGEPVIREYDQDASETVWICLDSRDEPGDRAEAAIETAASLAARAYHTRRRFALVTCAGHLEPGTGSAQMEGVLDALARLEFKPSGPRLDPPVDPDQCILISLSGAGRSLYGAAVGPGHWDDAGGVQEERLAG